MLKYLVILALFAACARPVLRTLPIPEPDCSWGALPLTVQMDPGAREYRDEVHDAMRAWSDAMGRKAFIWSYSDEVPPDVLVVDGPGSLDPTRYAGETVQVCERGRATSVVFFLRPLDMTEAVPIATHELGHTLGLGHSEHPDSVMQRRLNVGLMGDEPHVYRILALDARVANALHP